MWKNKKLAAYIRAKRDMEGLFLGVLALEIVVYALYGLPWGPSFYTLILSTALFLLIWVRGYVMYRKKYTRLLEMQRKEEIASDYFPKATDQVERLYQELLKKREEAWSIHQAREQEKRKQEDAYYTRWSHQIKTPVSVLRLLLQEEEPDTETMRHELFQIEQYIAMALDYQKLEKGTNDLSLGHFRAEDLVKQAVRNLLELFIHKKIPIQIGEDLDFTVLTDEKWFVFMMEQILTNAVKYTKKGQISVAREGEGEIVISDTGIGILPEDLPRVFEWGYTGYNGRLDKRSTGIGLALVKSAADLLGHPVRIESEPGTGTRVYIDTRRRKLSID